MMPNTYQFKKFTDSYIMHHKRVPAFLAWTIILTLVSISGLVVWSAFVVKPYVVKAQCIITTDAKSFITTSVSGRIKEFKIRDGQEVHAGDLLFKQESVEIDLQIDLLNINIMHCENLLEMFGPDDAILHEKDYYVAQRNAYIESKKQYCVVAKTSGIVSLDGVISKGMFLQAGAKIGTILDMTAEKVAESYISVTDRPKISIGDKASFAVSGLAQSEYGTISGELVSINTDASVIENNYYFKIYVKLDCYEIKSNKKTINLSYGMQGEVRIVYSETTYLKYFFELLL